MVYHKLEIELAYTTQAQSGVEGSVSTRHQQIFTMATADFDTGDADGFSGENLLGLYVYKVGDYTGERLHLLRAAFQPASDPAHSGNLLTGDLTVRWLTGDPQQAPFTLAYRFADSHDLRLVDIIPNDPGTHEWRLLLKRSTQDASAEQLKLIFIDREGSGDKPPEPCATLAAKLEGLTAEGKTETDNDYRTAGFRLQACLEREKKKDADNL